MDELLSFPNANWQTLLVFAALLPDREDESAGAIHMLLPRPNPILAGEALGASRTCAAYVWRDGKWRASVDPQWVPLARAATGAAIATKTEPAPASTCAGIYPIPLPPDMVDVVCLSAEAVPQSKQTKVGDWHIASLAGAHMWLEDVNECVVLPYKFTLVV